VPVVWQLGREVVVCFGLEELFGLSGIAGGLPVVCPFL
jgi:hypothetical protein